MKKKLLAFIITCVMITGVISTNYMNAHALSVGASYSAVQIIQLLFAMCGATTIKTASGVAGEISPGSIYGALNTKQAGIGDLVSSYVSRAQYLSPGSTLTLSEEDYQTMYEFFHNNDLDNISSGYTSSTWNDITAFCDAHGDSVVSKVLNNNVRNGLEQGTLTHLAHGEFNHKDTWALVGDYYIGQGNGALYPVGGASKIFASVDGSAWNNIAGGLGKPVIYDVQSTVGFYSVNVAHEKLKAGHYDILAKGRTADQQGTITGNPSIVMPDVSKLEQVLTRDDLQALTDLINVYPVDTDTGKMIYYPTQSLTDYVVPEITLNPSITFPGVDGSISDYTISLTDFFPFCIPWDIYDMLAAFVTTPETPEFTFQFPTGIINHQIQWTECTFDLHAWDGVASALRTIELISFAIGLGLMTRNIFLRG